MGQEIPHNTGGRTTPSLSVLMPVFNDAPKFITEAVDSVLNQSFVNFEFLILDDGSTQPATIDCLSQLAGQDSRIRLHREPHRGLTGTLNAGLSLCQAELTCRHDADDWSSPNRFLRQVDFMSKNPSVAVVGSAVELCQADGTPLWAQQLPCKPSDVLKAFRTENPFCHGAICFRTAAAREIGGFCDAFECSQDYDFLWRLCERFSGANLPDVLYHHRRNAASITSQRGVQLARESFMAQYLADQRAAGVPEDTAAAMEAAIREVPSSGENVLWKNGDQQLLSGHYLASLRCYLLSIASAPYLPKPYLKTLRWFLFVISPRRRASLFGH